MRKRADDWNGVLEDAGVSIVEGHGGHRSQAAAARQPLGELAEADHIVVGGEPAHLPREPLASLMKARAAGALRGLDDVVVAEDEAGVLQAPPNRRHTGGAKATVVGPRDQTHGVCAAFLVATTMTLLDTPRSTQDRVRVSRPAHARSLFHFTLRHRPSNLARRQASHPRDQALKGIHAAVLDDQRTAAHAREFTERPAANVRVEVHQQADAGDGVERLVRVRQALDAALNERHVVVPE